MPKSTDKQRATISNLPPLAIAVGIFCLGSTAVAQSVQHVSCPAPPNSADLPNCSNFGNGNRSAADATVAEATREWVRANPTSEWVRSPALSRSAGGASWPRAGFEPPTQGATFERDADFRNQINFNPFQNARLAVSIHARHPDVDPGNRPAGEPESAPDGISAITSPGKDSELGLSFTGDLMEVVLSRSTVVSPGSEGLDDEATRERTDYGSLSLNLDRYRQGGRWHSGLLPSSLTVSGSRAVTDTLAAPNGQGGSLTTFGLESTWWWPEAETYIGLWRGYRNSRLARLNGAGGEDWWVELSQSISRGDWNLLLSVSTANADSLEDGSRWITTAHSAGASLSLAMENLPALSLSFEVYMDRSSSPDLAGSVHSRSTSLDASLDFSKFLWPNTSDEKQRLMLLYRREITENYDSEAGATAKAEHAVLLSVRFHF